MRFPISVACALVIAQTASAQAALTQQLNVIVVTAQKRFEDIQNVPVAVSSVSDALLDATHANQLTDIGGYVPALQIDSSGTPGQTSISIRGIAPVGPGATVATYIGDTPVGSSSPFGGGTEFALDLLPDDFERLEVLRGPQGTLYGASSMGGLLKYVLRAPSLDQFVAHVGGDVFSVSEGGQAGSGVSAKASGPLLARRLAYTASFAEQVSPGFIDNPALGQRNQNPVRQQSGRLGLLWQAGEELKVTLDALYQGVSADGDANIALDAATLKPLVGDWSDNNLTGQPFEKDIHYYSAVVDDELAWAEILSASSYSDTRTSQTQDASHSFGVAFPAFGIPAGRSQNHYKLHLKKTTQEFRVQSLAKAKLSWLAGVFATYEDSSNFQSPSALDAAGASIPGLDPIYTAELPSTYTEYAAFADLRFALSDALELSGGVRHSNNRQVFSETTVSPIMAPVDLRNKRSNEDVNTYSFGAKYVLVDSRMIYARVASGYRPGGPNLSAPGIPAASRSDSLINYEVGVKEQILDGRMSLDAAVFYIDWSDIQVLANGRGFTYGTNGGTAKSEGIEASASLHPADGFVVDMTFAFVDAVLTEDVVAIGGLRGDRLPNIPRYSGSLRISYDHALSGEWAATGGAGIRLVGQRYSDVNHAVDSRPIAGYAAIDFSAGVSNQRYLLRVFGKNIANKRAYLNFSPLINEANGNITQLEATVLQPRVIGISIDAKF